MYRIETALKDAEQLSLFKVFLFFRPCLDLVNQFDFRVLVDSEDFEDIRTDAVVFL